MKRTLAVLSAVAIMLLCATPAHADETTVPPSSEPSAPVTVPDVEQGPTVADRDLSAPRAARDDVYYANCDEAEKAGAAPIRRGQPGYRPALDRDGDGTACDQDSGGTPTSSKPAAPAPPVENTVPVEQSPAEPVSEQTVLADTGVGGSALPYVAIGGVLLLAGGVSLFVIARRRVNDR